MTGKNPNGLTANLTANGMDSGGFQAIGWMPGSNFRHEAVVYPVMPEELRSVLVGCGDAEAEQFQAFLEASGIQCALRPGTAIKRPFGLTVRGLGRVEVLVVEADEERARELLALAEAGELRLDEDGDEE